MGAAAFIAPTLSGPLLFGSIDQGLLQEFEIVGARFYYLSIFLSFLRPVGANCLLLEIFFSDTVGAITPTAPMLTPPLLTV